MQRMKMVEQAPRGLFRTPVPFASPTGISSTNQQHKLAELGEYIPLAVCEVGPGSPQLSLHEHPNIQYHLFDLQNCC